MDLLHHLFRPKGTVGGDKATETGAAAAGDEAKRAVPHWRLERDETKLTRYTPFAPIADTPPGDLVLLLEDVLPRIPTTSLKAGLHSPEQKLCFSADDIFGGLTKGRVTIALSVLAERYPEIFEKPTRPEDDVQVNLPLQKLIQQVVQTEGKKVEVREPASVEDAHIVEEKVAAAETSPVEKIAVGDVTRPAPDVTEAMSDKVPEPKAAAPAPAPVVVPLAPFVRVTRAMAEPVARKTEPVPVEPPPPNVEFVIRPPQPPAAQKAPAPEAPPVLPSQPSIEPPPLLRPTVSANELLRGSPPTEATPAPAAKPEPEQAAPPAPEPPLRAEPAPRPPLSIPVPFAKPPAPVAVEPTFHIRPAPPLIRAPALNIPATVHARAAEPAAPLTPPAAIPIPRPSFAPPSEPDRPKEEPALPAAPLAEAKAPHAPLSEPEPEPQTEPAPEAAQAPPPPPQERPPEPEPSLKEGQIAATTIPEDEPPHVDPFSLERIDMEPLQAIFMTDEQLDLPRISELSAGLPGISGCLILAGETMTQGGERPSGLDAATLRELSRQLATTVDSFKNKLPAEPMFTLYGGNRALSIFARGLVSLCVVHATRGFLPGVRERLNAVADTLARGAEEGDEDETEN